MGKKKREHVVFDKMLVPKQSVPFNKVNTQIKQKNKATQYLRYEEENQSHKDLITKK